MAENPHPVVLEKIRRLIEEKGVANYDLKVTQGATRGDNYLGTIVKVTVDGENAEGQPTTLNWIVKCASQADAVRKYAQVDRLFKREIYVYEKLFPLFKELQVEHELRETFASTPTLHFKCTETYRETVVLEDMKSSLNFANVNRQRPLDLAHVVLVMKAYGKLHALSYALREQRPEEFKRIADEFKEKQNTNVNIDNISAQLKDSCARALETLSQSKDWSVTQAFKKFMERSFELQVEAAKLGSIGPHAVLSHGDAVVPNMLFKYDDPDRPAIPTDICLLDWQFARYGSPALDLSNFLFTATDKDFRDRYYDQMIKVYHYALCSYLTELGGEPEKVMPFNILGLQLKRYSVHGFCSVLMKLHLLMSDEDDAPVWNGDATTEDIEDTFGYRTRNFHEYKIRIHDVVSDFIDYGYLDFLN